MKIRGFLWSNLVRSVGEHESLYGSRTKTCHHRRFLLRSSMEKTHFSVLHSYSTESQPQISVNLLKIMEHRLSAIEHRSSCLEEFLNRPEASPAEYASANKELQKLKSSVDLISELRSRQKEIDDLKSLMDECPEDKDLLAVATEELDHAVEDETRLQNLLLKSLLPKDDADERDSILEVRAGTGGEEASLFAMEIFKMYERYSQKKGWKFEVVDITESDLRGYKVGFLSLTYPVEMVKQDINELKLGTLLQQQL